MNHDESAFVAHEPCPECNSSDALSRYDDGHAYCFSCRHYEPPNDQPNESPRRATRMPELLRGEVRALAPRGLSAETCRKFGIEVSRFSEQPAVVMPYRDQDGTVVAQKVRYGYSKSFTVLGDMKKALPLFGQHLWPPTGRRVVVTEGELDAAAYCQTKDLSWPTVSVPNGADGAKKSIAKALQWLLGYEEIVLAFDADEAGRKAVAECGPLFPPGRLKVAQFVGFKDANEAVLQGNEKALLKAVYDAAPWRPDGVVGLKDIRSKVLVSPALGLPYAWQGPTDATFGRQDGQVIGLGAGTGIGKTDWFTQMIAHDVLTLGLKVGVIYLEQDTGETGRRIAGKAARKPFHVPDGSWDLAELEAAWEALEATERVLLYDNFGAIDWTTVEAQMRFMINEGCKVIYLDHLTALAAQEDDENKALSRIMADMAGLAKATGAIITFISHLTTPDKGPPHEEGGRVTIRQFRGSRAIGFWTHILWGLERDQQCDDEAERTVTTLRCIKDRATGRATGKTFRLRYDFETGTLNEEPGEGPSSAAGSPKDLF